MTTKKQQVAKPPKPKRLYYKLDEAAKELTKHFGEEVTEDELIHWGAIESVQILVNISKFFFDAAAMQIHMKTSNSDLISFRNWGNDEWEITSPHHEDDIVDGLRLGDVLWTVRESYQHEIVFGAINSSSLQEFELDMGFQRFLIDGLIAISFYSNQIDLYDLLKDRWKEKIKLFICHIEKAFTKSGLYLAATEVERIKQGEERVFTQEEEEQQKQANEIFHQPQKAVRPQRQRSELTVIAALLAERHEKDETTTGRDLERAAELIGLTISDDTVRSIVKEAKALAPNSFK